MDDYWLKETLVEANHPTIIGKDMQVFDDGNTRGRKKSPLLAIQHNNYHNDPKAVLRDPDNLDFRLKEGTVLVNGGYELSSNDVPWKTIAFTGRYSSDAAPNIGPYRVEKEYYRIPGFQFPQASTPIPCDGTRNAKRDCDLMWLAGYGADKHIVYVGHSKTEVEQATSGGKKIEGNKNIYSFAEELEKGETIYWRVDALMGTHVIK
ncbi:hypothetical protein [Carboxylicivirga marina]|uniref:hypothetical protein n=1 Tax=Carboxylicivirga marina TaxID=2800988 RepID=UPI002594F315|nr:hypothetical protein [uncultured Carboxylicivirga sp.]